MQYPTVQTEMCLRIKQLTKLTTKSHSRALPDTPFSFNITTSDVLLHVVNYSLLTAYNTLIQIFLFCVCVYVLVLNPKQLLSCAVHFMHS